MVAGLAGYSLHFTSQFLGALTHPFQSYRGCARRIHVSSYAQYTFCGCNCACGSRVATQLRRTQPCALETRQCGWRNHRGSWRACHSPPYQVFSSPSVKNRNSTVEKCTLLNISPHVAKKTYLVNTTRFSVRNHRRYLRFLLVARHKKKMQETNIILVGLSFTYRTMVFHPAGQRHQHQGDSESRPAHSGSLIPSRFTL